MRRVSMATRDELVGAIAERYVQGGRAEKSRILGEFVAVTGFHRKHACVCFVVARPTGVAAPDRNGGSTMTRSARH